MNLHCGRGAEGIGFLLDSSGVFGFKVSQK